MEGCGIGDNVGLMGGFLKIEETHLGSSAD